MTNIENPRAVAGDNQAPEYARRITDQMARDYAALADSVTSLLAKAAELPKEAETDDDATAMGLVVKEIREADGRTEAYRIAEKAPHKAAVDAVDAFFFTIRDKLQRRNPRDRSQKAGAADILQARIDDYLENKRIAEQARRQREADEARRIEQEARDRQAQLDREAEQKRLEAERARKPEQIEAKTAVAEKAQQTAAVAAATTLVAQDKAEAAHIATLAKPAEMARTRGDGVLLTQARVPYALLTDRTKVDKEKLWPFFTADEIEKALRGWARTTGHVEQMEGAEIGFGRKGVTR